MEGGSGVNVPVSSHNWPRFWRYVGACSAAAVIKTCAFPCGNSAKMFWNLCGDWRWIVCIILMRPQRIPKKISTWLKKKKESSHSQSEGTKNWGVKSREKMRKISNCSTNGARPQHRCVLYRSTEMKLYSDLWYLKFGVSFRSPGTINNWFSINSVDETN